MSQNGGFLNPKTVANLSRRHLLRLGASGAISWWALQGCMQGVGSIFGRNADAPDADMAIDNDLTDVSERGGLEETRVIQIAFSQSPGQLDPALFATIESFQFGFMIYDALVWVDHELTPQPMLAESWQQSDDLLSWTFRLRTDVVFHHGKPFTSQDVVYTINRLIDPESGSRLQTILSFVADVKAIDDHTVHLNLHTPNADLPLLLGAAPARVVSHDYDADRIVDSPSGTGPFRVQKIVPNQRTEFVRNEEYWEVDRLHLPAVNHVYISSLEQQAAGFVDGEIDLIPDAGAAHLALLADSSEAEILQATSGAYQPIVMQATEPPFDDVRVRQALKYCVDRPEIVQQVLHGRGEEGDDHPIASISPFWADTTNYVQDINQARNLLAEAGYPNGLHLELITSTSRPGMLDLANTFRTMAAPAGVIIDVIEAPADVYWSDYSGKVPFHVGSWNFRPSIDETFMLAYHSNSFGNESKWSRPELDEWIDTARAEPDLEKRKALYQQAQQLINEEGAVIIPYFRSSVAVVRKNIQGFAPHPAGWLDLRNVTIDGKTNI